MEERKIWLTFTYQVYEFTTMIVIELRLFWLLQCGTKHIFLWSWFMGCVYHNQTLVTFQTIPKKAEEEIVFYLPSKEPHTKHCYILIQNNWPCVNISFKEVWDKFDEPSNLFIVKAAPDPPLSHCFLATPPEIGLRKWRRHFKHMIMKTCRLSHYRWGWAWVSKALVEGNTPRAGKGKTQTKLWSSQAAWMHEAWDYVSRPPVYEGPKKAGESPSSLHWRSASLHLLWKTDTRKRRKRRCIPICRVEHSWDVPQIGVPDTIHVGERERWWTPRIHRWGISDEEEPSGKNKSWWVKLVWHILTIQNHAECIVLKSFSTK